MCRRYIPELDEKVVDFEAAEEAVLAPETLVSEEPVFDALPVFDAVELSNADVVENTVAVDDVLDLPPVFAFSNTPVQPGVTLNINIVVITIGGGPTMNAGLLEALMMAQNFGPSLPALSSFPAFPSPTLFGPSSFDLDGLLESEPGSLDAFSPSSVFAQLDELLAETNQPVEATPEPVVEVTPEVSPEVSEEALLNVEVPQTPVAPVRRGCGGFGI